MILVFINALISHGYFNDEHHSLEAGKLFFKILLIEASGGSNSTVFEPLPSDAFVGVVDDGDGVMTSNNNNSLSVLAL